MRFRDNRDERIAALEAELKRAHGVSKDMAHSLLDSAERTSSELAVMRAEIATLRADLVERELQTLRHAFDALRDSGEQVGIVRQQLALAERPDLVELAGEMVAAGASDFLAAEEAPHGV